MMLLTQANKKALPALYETDGVIPPNDKIAVVKFFHPFCSKTWYAVEFDPKQGLFFGWVEAGRDSEWGYFSLEEFKACKVHGLGMERDMYWTPKPMKEVRNYSKMENGDCI